MKIISVKISNILSIEDAFIEFDDKGLILVQGWNFDVDRSNGAGKTAIFNAITFALYDKLPRKITATEILRRGSKTGYVEVIAETGGNKFKVKRSRPKGLSFFKEDVPQTITQLEWESLIGLNYNQYIETMYCAQGASTRFLSLNDSDKKQFMLQLLNLEEFSSCKTLADNKVKEFEKELVTLNTKESGLTSKVDAYSESLVDEEVYSARIADVVSIVAKLSAELIEVKKVVKPDLTKFQSLEDSITLKKNEFIKVKMKREMLHNQYRKLNAGIQPFQSESSCERCGSRLDTTAAKSAHEKHSETLISEGEILKRQISDCDSALANETQVLEMAAKLAIKKKENLREYELASLKASDLELKLALKQQESKDLKLKLDNNSELLNKIKALTSEREDISAKKIEILSSVDLYKTVSSLYAPTGAQAYILDSVIDSFNDQVSIYVSKLWSNLTYSLQSYKENVKGEVTAKFSESLSMDGVPISIGSLSGGEFRALSLCIDFALINVMEAQFGISMSPIILDEPFDGLDAVGRETIIDLLGAISESRQVAVIDHTSEVKSMFSKVFMVEKRNGISTVKLEA